MKTIKVKCMAIFLALFMALGLAACGKEAASGSGARVFKVGLIQLIENGAFKDMREGFVAKLAELGFVEGENLDFNYQNAQGDTATMTTICQQMIDDGVDLIATIATPPAQVALQTLTGQGSDIPMLFISVSDPLTAGLVSDMAAPDKNATGTSNAIPIDENFKLAEKLTPGIETYGFLYTTGENNAVATVNEAKAYCDANGLKYEEAVVADSSEVQQAALSLVSRCDAMFVPNDSVVQSAMTQVAQVAMDAKIPLYGSSAVMVASGALATISISDYKLGEISAEMAAEILNGKTPAEVPAIVVDTFTTVINTDTAAALGVEIPADVLKDAETMTGMV